jgi:hypothetical protein
MMDLVTLSFDIEDKWSVLSLDIASEVIVVL